MPDVDVVIRPSGIWDTRAPFNSYLTRHARINDTFHSLNLVIGCIAVAAREAGPAISARKLLRVKEMDHAHALSMSSYQTTLTSGPEKREPTASDVNRSMRGAAASITHHAIVTLSGTFE